MNETTEDNESIAIIGAGPIGIETALYARFLGYEVTLFEANRVCDHVRQWGHVQLFTPFRLNRSPLGIQALKAQDESFEFLDDEQLHTGDQWITHYLEPLSQTDLLRNCIRTNCRVIAVGRECQTKQENVGKESRNESYFRVLFEDSEGQHYESFDYVVDTSGTYGTARYFGSGGLPAIGETELRRRKLNSSLFYSIPKLTSEQIEGKKILLIGAGYSAAANAVSLASFIDHGSDTDVVWLTRKSTSEPGPVKIIDNDPLQYRDELANRANQIAKSHQRFRSIVGGIIGVEQSGDTLTVRVEKDGDDGVSEIIECHLIIANVGYKGDFDILNELQLHRCYATDGPIKWAASLMSQAGADCMSQTSGDSSTLLTSEPDFFVLGSKLYGRDNRFLFSLGLEQIRDTFKIIVGRDSLDLYQTIMV